MNDAYLKELMEEMHQLRLEDCTKDEILDFVEKLLLLSKKLLKRVHSVERKLEALEQKQDLLLVENNRLAANLEKVITLAGENPRAAMTILMQLNRDNVEKKPRIIN
ncbi:MAG: hypothetical protein AB1796_14360 [Bacillota bacterium]